MDTATRALIVIPLWVLTGAVLALVMRRRGHDLTAWLVLGVVFGPFAVPLASRQVRRALAVRPLTVARGRPSSGHLDVLVGIDGSAEAYRAAEDAVAAFGPSLGRLTLAAVMDTDESLSRLDPDNAAIWGEDRRHEDRCRAHLAEAARRLGDAVEPTTVVLSGDPVEALERFAVAEGADFVVVGPRGRGASRALLGSVATRLARGDAVPVIIGRRVRPAAAVATPGRPRAASPPRPPRR